MAVTFRYIANENPVEIASFLIQNQMFNAWNVSLETLYQIALTNTIKKFPCKINSLLNLVSELMKNNPVKSDDLAEEMLPDIESEKDMYVLSNETGINGATCILYDAVVKNFADNHDCNVFILPSSLHEVMLVPENEKIESQFLKEMVLEVNQTAVDSIDLLSDNIYYYDRESDEIRIYD